MRKLICFLIMMLLVVTASNAQENIACQAWAFNAYSLEETLEKMEELNIKYIEMYPKQRFSKKDSTLVDYNMSAEYKKRLKKLLKKHGVKVTSYGVISRRKRADWVKIFEFAKEMGIKNIVTEPEQNQIPVIDELCQKYKIYASIHNHGKPKRHWWNPANVKEGIKDRSKYLKVCADVGHWKRSDLDIVASLKMLEGKIFELHVKDVNEATLKAKWVPMGTGVIPWGKVFEELKRQNFKGKYYIEHVTKKDQVMEHMRYNISFLKKHLK